MNSRCIPTLLVAALAIALAPGMAACGPCGQFGCWPVDGEGDDEAAPWVRKKPVTPFGTVELVPGFNGVDPGRQVLEIRATTGEVELWRDWLVQSPPRRWAQSALSCTFEIAALGFREGTSIQLATWDDWQPKGQQERGLGVVIGDLLGDSPGAQRSLDLKVFDGYVEVELPPTGLDATALRQFPHTLELAMGEHIGARIVLDGVVLYEAPPRVGERPEGLPAAGGRLYPRVAVAAGDTAYIGASDCEYR